MSQLPKYNSEQKRHRLRLLNISKKLTKEDLEGLLYLIQDILPKDAAAKIDSGIQLFQQLENQGYLGLNDYTQLKNWLEDVERNDLAKLLPVDSDLQVVCYNPSVQQKIEESHRFLLISVSSCLRVRDLHQLCYLCAIPKCAVHGITESYQLFEELEKQDRLGSGNYGFLQKCLCSIGRDDLAGMFKQPLAVDVMVPDIPKSLKGFSQTLNALCRSRRSTYASKTRRVRELSSDQLDTTFWRKLIEKPCGEFFLTLKMDLPDWWQPDMRDDCSASEVNSIIDTSLRSIFSFAAADLESLQSGFPVVDTQQSRQPFHDCYRCYAKFNQAVERVQWNNKIRQKVQQMHSKKECPIGKAAREASDCIQAVCKDFLWEESIQEDVQRVEETFHMLESFYYIQWQRELMFQWMSILIYLASNLQLDLRLHLPMLLKLLTQHKDGITQNSDTLSSIIGQEVLDQLMPTLLLDGIVQQHSDSCVSRNCTLSTGVLWYIFFLELTALAMGCSINPQKVSETYLEQFCRGEKYENMICGAIQLGHVLVNEMHSKVSGLRKTVLGLARSEHLRALTLELLPEESNAGSDSV